MRKIRRRLLPNYRPNEVERADRTLLFGLNKTKWTAIHDQWLTEHYADAEDHKLAFALNCDESVILANAKVLKLKKSELFLRWLSGMIKQDPHAPQGYHYESDEELQARLNEEDKEDHRWAKHLAMTFERTSAREKRALADAMYGALKWAREHE
ncbi:MAG: hypothetical protein IJ557_02670 [Bacteroidaceae bacterium]|nr:hypothetical protein [Bacteroidaceae bacterium]